MGKLHWSNMIFRRQLITAITATITLAVLLAYTDAAHIDDTVVPEKLDFAAYSTSASFIQAMSKSGGTEEDCRTFATTTITTIEASVKSAQETLDIADKGEECAQEGQNVATNTQVRRATHQPRPHVVRPQLPRPRLIKLLELPKPLSRIVNKDTTMQYQRQLSSRVHASVVSRRIKLKPGQQHPEPRKKMPQIGSKPTRSYAP